MKTPFQRQTPSSPNRRIARDIRVVYAYAVLKKIMDAPPALAVAQRCRVFGPYEQRSRWAVVFAASSPECEVVSRSRGFTPSCDSMMS